MSTTTLTTQRFVPREPFTRDEANALKPRRVRLGGLCTEREGLDADGTYWDPRDSWHVLDIVPGLRAVFHRDHSTQPAWNVQFEVFAPDKDSTDYPRAGWVHLPVGPGYSRPCSDTMKAHLVMLRHWLVTTRLTPENLVLGVMRALGRCRDHFEAQVHAGELAGYWGAEGWADHYQLQQGRAREAARLLGIECPDLPELDTSPLWAAQAFSLADFPTA